MLMVSFTAGPVSQGACENSDPCTSFPPCGVFEACSVLPQMCFSGVRIWVWVENGEDQSSFLEDCQGLFRSVLCAEVGVAQDEQRVVGSEPHLFQASKLLFFYGCPCSSPFSHFLEFLPTSPPHLSLPPQFLVSLCPRETQGPHFSCNLRLNVDWPSSITASLVLLCLSPGDLWCLSGVQILASMLCGDLIADAPS